jgi:phosphate acetyltransferase
MTRHVYVMAMEAGTGKSTVVPGKAEVLSRRAGRMALCRPRVAAADPPDPDIELVRRRYALPLANHGTTAGHPQDADGDHVHIVGADPVAHHAQHHGDGWSRCSATRGG